jgi:hypothetical protein
MAPTLSPPLRIGICGFFLESNRWSPVTTQAMFAASLDISGGYTLSRVVKRTAANPTRYFRICGDDESSE